MNIQSLAFCSAGLTTVAVVDCKENYAAMEISLRDFSSEVNDLCRDKNVVVNGKAVQVELFLGGDMKVKDWMQLAHRQLNMYTKMMTVISLHSKPKSHVYLLGILFFAAALDR